MKNSYIILFLLIFIYACKPSKVVLTGVVDVDSSKFTYLYSEALKNKMLGQSKVAKDQFIECLEMNPSSTASAYQLADIFIAEGDFNRAKEFSDFCNNKVTDNEWYLIQRSLIAKRLNEVEVYNKIYDRLVVLHPGNISYLFEHAVLKYESKKYDEALETLKLLEEEVGVNENIVFLRNSIYFSLKRMDAIQLELRKLCKAYPDSLRYSDMLAEFYLSTNQGEKAMDIYKNILLADSSNAYASMGIAWIYGNTANYNLGYSYLMAGLNSESVPYERKSKVADLYLNSNSTLIVDSLNNVYLALVKNNSNEITLLNRYLRFLFDQKKYASVKAFAITSIEKFPDNFTAWEFILNSLMIEGRNEDLKKYSLKALEYFPNHAVVFFYNGYAQFLMAEYNEAINYFEMGMDYVSGNNDLEKQLLVYLAESYHKISKFKQSDSYFEKYLKLDSTNGFILNNYAFYLTQRNVSLDKALLLSRKSIEIDPFNSAFLDTYAWILFNLSDYDKSMGYIERAYKYGGNTNPVIVEHYGDILYKKTKVEDALERWKEAYSLNRNNKKLLDKINKIELEN